MNRDLSRRDILTATCVGLSTLPLLITSRATQGENLPKGAEIRFRDLTGAEVVLSGPARRIIDLWTVGTAFAIAAHGSPARMIAVNNRAHEIFKRGLIGRLYPEVFDIPSDVLMGNGAPNIERLIKLNPDLVVDFMHGSRDGAAAMRNAGLQVARYTEMEGGIVPTIAALLRMYGEIIGDTSRSEPIISLMEQTMKRLDALSSVPQSARPSVIQLMQHGDRLYASGGGVGGIYSDFIYLAGGVNAAASLPGITPTSVEQIMAWDPDVILLFQQDDTAAGMIYDHPILGDSKAAHARRVYVVPIGTNNWGSMGPDEYLSPIWLAELLHPDRIDNMLREDMRRVFKAILGHTFSDGDLDTILRIDLNGNSAGYDRFLRDG